jgi:hypothetical protein
MTFTRLIPVLAAFLAACGTPPRPIGESTAPKDIGTAKSPAVTGQHQIIATYKDARSRDLDSIAELAEKRATERCKEHSVVRETRRTGEEATSRMMGIAGPWVELTIQCLELKQGKVSGLGAVVVESESRGLPDASYFDIHTEVIQADFERVHAAVVKVLREQGDPAFRPEDTKARGLIKTGRARHGALGFPTYEQYVIALDIESSSTTRVTFRLLSHWPDFKVSQRDPPFRPSERKYVYRKAAEFVERVRVALR